MHNIMYILMSIICFILGGISTYFAAISYKEKHWWMFAYDISTVLLNLIVMFVCLTVIYK